MIDINRHARILSFVRNQLGQGSTLLQTLTHNTQGSKLPYRDVYHTVLTYIHNFATQRNEPRWIAVTGLRGVGKTTLLAQLHTDIDVPAERKLYLALDQAADLGFSLQELLAGYEELLGTSFESMQTPVYLFLDEVQYQKQWAITVKTLYDRSRNVFIVATGSSALSLQTNADSARRMVIEKLYPLGFPEYIHAKTGKTLDPNVAQRLQYAIFHSNTPTQVYTLLQKETSAVHAFWTGIERFEIDRYLKFGSLPFSLSLANESLIYQQIATIVDAIITKDVTQLNVFDKPTLVKLSQLLYAVAGADKVSIAKLAETIQANPKTVIQALDALEKTEVVLRLYPYGAHYSQVKKPSKYLFTSSAYRAMYYNLVGSVEQFDLYTGKLLEDVVGMYLFRLFARKIGTSLTYDSAESGADFILTLSPHETRIVLEIGTGKKGVTQAATTLQKVGGKYGVIVSQTDLSLRVDANCVFLPLEYFLLL